MKILSDARKFTLPNVTSFLPHSLPGLRFRLTYIQAEQFYSDRIICLRQHVFKICKVIFISVSTFCSDQFLNRSDFENIKCSFCFRYKIHYFDHVVVYFCPVYSKTMLASNVGCQGCSFFLFQTKFNSSLQFFLLSLKADSISTKLSKQIFHVFLFNIRNYLPEALFITMRSGVEYYITGGK